MTPEIFIKEIEHYLDRCEIDIDYMTSNNIDSPEYEKIFWGNDIFDFYFGATRGCFIPAYDPTFVFKFDFNELWEEYCEIERCYYKEAAELGLEKCFAKVTFFDNIGNTRIYKYEYVDTTAQRKKFRPLSEHELKQIDKIESSHKKKFTFPSTWSMDFIDYHGAETYEKFLSFVEAHGINDLHSTNIGYIKGRPVVFDYAGFFEPSSSC